MRTPVAAICLTAALVAQDAELRWTDVADWPIEGRAFAERAAPYDRLPSSAEAKVRKPVWNLSRHTAGMAVRFVSDATELHVRYRLTSAQLAMHHMPATGVSGVDLYARDGAGALRWVGVSRPTAQNVRQRLADGLAAAPKGGREFVLYLPLYNGLARLELGVPAGASLRPAPPRRSKPVVVYGTSIAQGACATRPGMAWPAILSRMLDREVVNLGFSGNGRMETAVGTPAATIDAAAFVVDCLPNMTAAQVEKRTAPLVRQLRAARPAAEVLLVEDRTFAHAWLRAGVRREHEQLRRALRDAFATIQQGGDEHVHLLAGADLLGTDGEGTTDGSHPNDLGMMRQARHVAAALRKILR